jgi:predicted nucleic acid-binding protein
VIVLDSSFLIAYHNARDVHHDSAAGVMARLVEGEWGVGLLPEYVFLEVMTVLRARRDTHTAVAVGDSLLRAREVDFVPCSEFFLDTFSIFRAEGSRGLSFADAAIVAIANRYGAERIATFDSGFKGLEHITVIPETGAS